MFLPNPVVLTYLLAYIFFQVVAANPHRKIWLHFFQFFKSYSNKFGILYNIKSTILSNSAVFCRIFDTYAAVNFISGSCHLDSASNVEIGAECQIFVIVIFFNSKEIIFSDLYYFQIWFSCRLKKSKQTFNTKFVTRRSVQMTWTGHNENFLMITRRSQTNNKPTVDSADSEQIVQHFCYNIWNKCEIYVSVEKKNLETLLLAEIWTTQS